MQICNGAAVTDARRPGGKGSKFGKSRAQRTALEFARFLDDRRRLLGAFWPHQRPFESMCGF
jgi:hypothetical protein